MLRRIDPNNEPVRRPHAQAKRAFSFSPAQTIANLAQRTIEGSVEDLTKRGNPYKGIFERSV